MSFLICAASDKEMRALAPAIFGEDSPLPEMQPVARNVGGRELLFLVTGIGPINAALAVGLCLGRLKSENSPRLSGLIYAGLAGSFDLEKVPLLSICLVTKEIWPEYGLHDGISVTARAFKFPLWIQENGMEIYDTLNLATPADLGLKPVPDDWVSCTSLTVAGVSASFQRRDRLSSLYGAELENMEGFAAAYACAREAVPCLEIRVVSNKVGPRSRAEKDFEGALEIMGQILSALNLTRR